MDTKVCNTCGIERDISAFYKKQNAPDHWVAAKYNPKCKPCANEKNRKLYVKKPAKKLLEEKTCTGCKQTKPLDAFYEKTTAKPGWVASRYSPKCKECEKAYKREFFATKKQSRPQKITTEPTKKKCNICELTLPLESFYKLSKVRGTLSNYRPYCKPCDKRLAVDKRNLNKDEVNRRSRLRRLETGPEINARRKARIASCPEYRERAKQYKKTSKDRFPIRAQTRDRTKHLVQAGVIKKLPCSVCGNENSQAHHEDYSQHLEVVWYCKRHHADRHRELREMGLTWDEEGKQIKSEDLRKMRLISETKS